MTYFNNLPLELKLLILKNVPTHTMLLSWVCVSKELHEIYVDNKESIEKEHHQTRYVFGYLDQFSPEKLQHILQNHPSFQDAYQKISLIQARKKTEVEKTTLMIEAALKSFASALIIALDPTFKNYLKENIAHLSDEYRQKAQALINSDQNNLFPAFYVSIANLLKRRDLSDQNFHLKRDDLLQLLYREPHAFDEDINHKITFLIQSGWGKKILLEDMHTNKENSLLDRIAKILSISVSNKQFILQDTDYRFQILLRQDGSHVLRQIITFCCSSIILFSILKDPQYCQKIEKSKAVVAPSIIVDIITLKKLSAWSVCALLNHDTLKRWLCIQSNIITSDHLQRIFKAYPYKEVIQLLLKEDLYRQALFANEKTVSAFKACIHQSKIVFSEEEREALIKLKPEQATIHQLLPIAPVVTDEQARTQHFALHA